MLLTGFPAEAFATNCYVIATAAGQDCVVVDPGIGVIPRLEEVLREHRLRPAAVMLTHGHLDHVFSVTPVCGARGIAAYIHADDAYRVTDPISLLAPPLRAMLEAQFGDAMTWHEPEEVQLMKDGERLDLAGLEFTIDHAPGHTEGSVLFRLPGDRSTDGAPVCVSGDVLFAGSIGRTDMVGGDHAAMLRSLRTKILTLPDEVVVLPGHGPATTIGAERAANPYLLELVD